jgi:hypothetical protein
MKILHRPAKSVIICALYQILMGSSRMRITERADIVRTGEMRNAYKIFFGKPKNGYK